VQGASFIALVGTLMVIPTIPVAGMALILGIDRFMSMCRATVNMIGNGVGDGSGGAVGKRGGWGDVAEEFGGGVGLLELGLREIQGRVSLEREKQVLTPQKTRDSG